MEKVLGIIAIIAAVIIVTAIIFEIVGNSFGSPTDDNRCRGGHDF